MACKTDEKWIWVALYNLNTKLLTSGLVPVDWDWNQIHPKHGTPMMTVVENTLRLHHVTRNSESAPVWELVKHLLSNGADPRKEVENADGHSCGWGGTFPKVEKVFHKGHSAITLVFAILKIIEAHKEYEMQIKNAQKLLGLFSEYQPIERPLKIVITESTVDFWETLLLSNRFTDVELNVIGPSLSNQEESGVLRAHSNVLRTASPVLDAILSAPMVEKSSGTIKVEGTSFQSVQLCLKLMYTGSTTADDLDAAVLLGALDVAHRWQVIRVVDILEQMLIREIAEETFETILETAILKNLHQLLTACKCFATNSSTCQKLLTTQLSKDRNSSISMSSNKKRRVTH